MFQYKGIWLPEGETHYQMIMDSHKSPEVEGKGTYQYRKLAQTLGRTPGRRVAIDIGANIGFWSMHLVKKFKFLHAFEPAVLYRDCFEKNMPVCDNFEMHPYALGDAEFKWPLVTANPIQSGNTYLDFDHDPDDDDVEMVQVKTLDSFNIHEVDLIKIDCEGYELAVIKGGQETILLNKPAIIVEQKPGWPSKHGFPELGAVHHLESLGMKLLLEYSGDYIMGW